MTYIKTTWYCIILIFAISTVFFNCDGNRARDDMQNAIVIGKTLKNGKHATPDPIFNYPKNNEPEESSTVHTHTLKPGENLQDLAVLYDTDWQSILKANGIENPEDMKPGQKILIPAKKSRQ